MRRTDDCFVHDEFARYQRQIDLPEIGGAGQLRLRRSRVLVMGAGGLGSPAAMYLAAAGVGTLGIMDADCVEISNLQRQILHGDRNLGMRKTLSARETLAALNPTIEVTPITDSLTSANAADIISCYDVVLGCVDNFSTRYAVNAACAALRKPNVFAAAARFEGQASVFTLDNGPCYRCFFRDPPDESLPAPPAEKGVLGVVPGVMGCIQATEAIKILLGTGKPLSGRLLLYDALGMRFREIPLRRDPECPVCGEKNGSSKTEVHA